MTSAPIPVDDDVANAVEPRRFLFKAAVFVSLIAVAAATIVYTEYPTRLAFQLVLAAVLAHGTELVHECIHRLATGRERVDRCIGSILAQTTCISFALYHFLHLQHHRYVGTPHDRDSFSDALARLHSSSRHTRIRALLRHLTMADHWKATARRVAAAAVGRLAQELISEQPTLPAAVAQRVQRDYRVIDPSSKQARLTLRGAAPLLVEGVVLSGPGRPRRLPVDKSAAERVFDGGDYWTRRTWFDRIPHGRIAVIGSGETAGSIVQSLIKTHPAVRIHLVNRHGFLPIQSAGYAENSLCTSADSRQWCERSIEEREETLRRIDRGVMSADLKEEIDLCDRVRVVRGCIESIKKGKTGVVLNAARSNTLMYEYDAVILAIGFDPYDQLRELMPDGTLDGKCPPVSRMLVVDRAFRLPNVAANVHAPGLSGMSQGPGYALLSCLGSVASRILEPYLGPGDS